MPMPPPQLDFSAIHVFLSVCAMVLGMVWGSFFNVCIFRIPAKKSIVNPPSHCGTCGTPLKPWQNVPVLGWLLLGGRCGHCGQSYGVRYPMVEGMTGLLFLMVYLQTGPGALLLLHAVFAGLLVVGIFTDIDHFILPDRITIGGTAVAIALSPLAGADSIAARDLSFLVDQAAFWANADWAVEAHLGGWQQGLAGSLAGAACGYGLLWAVAVAGRVMFQKEAMGGGDVKLFALIGAVLGPVNVFLVLFGASMIGLVLGGSALLMHRLFGRDEMDVVEVRAWDRPVEADAVSVSIDRVTARRLREVPFGPHIALAALAAMLFQADVRALFHDQVDAAVPALGRKADQGVWKGVEIPAVRLVKPVGGAR